MKLISWNVNGIRAVHRKNAFPEPLFREKPDILCVQETKALPEQIPEEVRTIPEYRSYFHAPDEKRGYSGVGVYTRITPDEVQYGIGDSELDREGRALALFFGKTVLFNVYFPNGGGGSERLAYKMKFYEAFLDRINILHHKGYSIIFGGDVNTAHHEIDLARPKENVTNTGFLPEERAWIDAVTENGYIDTFRYFFPEREGAYTYWDMKTRARDRNVGWRIDYFFVSPDLVPILEGAGMLSHIYGSDHCPIFLEMKHLQAA